MSLELLHLVNWLQVIGWLVGHGLRVVRYG